MKFEIKSKQILVGFFVTFLCVLFSTWYIFILTKDYNYYLEGYCPANNETCFYRDCSEDGSCYEYQQEIYSIFKISAKEFEKCGGINCSDSCLKGELVCEQIICDSENYEQCYDSGKFNKASEDINSAEEEAATGLLAQ